MGYAILRRISWYFINEIPRKQSKYFGSWQSIRNTSHFGTSFHSGAENWRWRQHNEWILGQRNRKRQIFLKEARKAIRRVTATQSQTITVRKAKNRKVGKEIKESRRIKSYKSWIRWICTGIFKLICVWNKTRTKGSRKRREARQEKMKNIMIVGIKIYRLKIYFKSFLFTCFYFSCC